MSNSKSDKPLVITIIAACVAAILIFIFTWSKHFFHNLDNWAFTLIEGGLIALFLVEAIGAYRYSEDPSKDWKRVFVILIAVAICGWTGGWAAGNNEKKMFEDDVKKAKQSAALIDQHNTANGIYN